MNAPMTAPISDATAVVVAPDADVWSDVCDVEDVLPWSGVCALVGGRQIAVVRTADAVFALDNRDPFSGAMVLARGIVGDAKGAPKIASPIYKQAFDLRTGRCLDDASVRVATYPCRIRDGRIEIGT